MVEPISAIHLYFHKTHRIFFPLFKYEKISDHYFVYQPTVLFL